MKRRDWFRSDLYSVPSEPYGTSDTYREFRMLRGQINASRRVSGTWAIKKVSNQWKLFLVCPYRSCRAIMAIRDPDIDKNGYPESHSSCDYCQKCQMHMWYSLNDFKASDYKKLYPWS